MISKHVTFKVKANNNTDWDDIPGRTVKIQARKPEHIKNFIVKEVRKTVDEFNVAVEATFIAHHPNGSPAVISHVETPSGFGS